MAPADDLPLWFKCTTRIDETRTWRDPLALRLWLYLLAKAKLADDGGRVRFSYATARPALAWRENRKLVEPSTKAVRGALMRLAKGPDANLVVPDGERRAAQGGARGYFVVTVRDYETWYPPKVAEGTGPVTEPVTNQGMGRAWAGHPPGTLNPESDPRVRGSDWDPGPLSLPGSDLAGDVDGCERLLLSVDSNRKPQRGKGRTLLAPSKYAQSLWRAGAIDEDRYAELSSIPTCGSLYAALDPRGFNDLVRRVAKGIGDASKTEAYARTALATALHEHVVGRSA